MMNGVDVPVQKKTGYKKTQKNLLRTKDKHYDFLNVFLTGLRRAQQRKTLAYGVAV